MIGYLIFVGVVLIFVAGLMIGFGLGRNRDRQESPPKCPHGYEWDDCPVCCH